MATANVSTTKMQNCVHFLHRGLWPISSVSLEGKLALRKSFLRAYLESHFWETCLRWLH